MTPTTLPPTPLTATIPVVVKVGFRRLASVANYHGMTVSVQEFGDNLDLVELRLEHAKTTRMVASFVGRKGSQLGKVCVRLLEGADLAAEWNAVVLLLGPGAEELYRTLAG